MEEKKLTGYPSIDKPWLKYYPDGANETPIPAKTAWQFVFDKQKENGKNIAFRYLGKKISFTSFFSSVQACAKALKAIGVKYGDIVTLALPTAPETVYLFYALNRIGAISNAMDPRLKKTDFLRSIKETNSKYVFATNMSIPELLDIANEHAITIVQVSPFLSAPIAIKFLATAKNKTRNSIIDWKNFLAQGKSYTGNIDEPFRENTPVTIVHTGGTTGIPKGVVLTNENFNAMALTQEVSGFNLAEKDSFLTFLPPFIAYCLVNAIHDPLYLGFENTLIPKFEYSDFPKLILKHKPNHVLGGPILWDSLIRSELARNADLSFLKSPISGGDAMNIELENRINDFFFSHNCTYHIQQGYGMSEVSAAACYSSENSYCPGSVGIPYVKNVISIFDVETQEELTYGNDGEVCIQSPTMMKEYYKNRTETDAIVRTHSDGSVWLHTGDCGMMNSNGNLFIKGRMKRMIVRSGNKIFPATVESVIMQHPSVLNCAVVQMRHKEERHVPVAFLVINKDTATDIISELKTKIGDVLPEFNIPYQFVIKDELPLTGINKIDFRALECEAQQLEED